ncbi:membrane protein, putative [Labilithrix luteola]|uniref:Membrane protein, putative n=1 Tax=Labilithrix luteola TaxID=1391654 RepID=A0A0K1Q1E9_9BACT|nr:DMT family transporter [Labilithrix luteola]AKU99461.1 membrane protein, putative [Labilithrix luteola]
MIVDERARRASGYALVAIAASGWGTWPLILRHAPIPAALQSAIMMAVQALTGLVVVLLGDRVRARASLSQWAAVLWLGVSDALNVLLFFAAYQRTKVAIAVLTHDLTPIFVALAAPIFLREKAQARTFFAVAVAFFGLVLLLEPWCAGFGRSDLAGAALGAASALFYASNVLVNKRLLAVFSASELMFFHSLVAAPLLFALVPPSEYGKATPAALGVVLAGAVGPGAICGLMFVWGLRRVPASHASILTLIEPFVAVVLAALVLQERLGTVQIVGGLLILAGAFVVIGAEPAKVGVQSTS